VTETYAGRSRHHVALRDAELRKSARISHFRLATFLSGVAILIWTLSHHATPQAFALSGALFVVFGGLVFWHAKVEERAAWFDALRQADDWALARVERRWDDLPAAHTPRSIDVAHHPYALDLDVFGRASLFQWLGPAATPSGGHRLAEWLLSAAEPDEIRARQTAATELASLDTWREALAAHGELAKGARPAEIDVLLAWAEDPAVPSLRLLQTLAVILTAAIWVLLLLFVAGFMDAALWLLPFVSGIVLSFAMAKRIYTAFDRAGAGQQALGRYAALFEHLTAPRFESARLREVQERLSAGCASAPECMRRLNRILGCAELRTAAAILHFPIQALTLWDFHVMFALERWRQGAGRRVRGWFEALGDLDALSALAAVRYDNPRWCMPHVDPAPLYLAEGLGHPLLTDDRRICNDVTVGPPGTLLLVTGSNMSGKSTLLRAIGLNTVLAQAGGCVCATTLTLPPADLQTSIRVQDSLELGLSYFMAALARLKGVVDAAERPRPGRVLLYLLDEILQGTNSAEREIAVLAVARHLLDAGAIGAMTTHDLNLAGREPLKSTARLVHFTEIVDEQGRMGFDYRLRDGIATSRNALRLMKLIGIDL
jgi:hypothetical protein